MRDTAAAAGATAADVASLVVLTLQYCGPEAVVIPTVAILADVCRGSALTPDGCPQSSVGLFRVAPRRSANALRQRYRTNNAPVLVSPSATARVCTASCLGTPWPLPAWVWRDVRYAVLRASLCDRRPFKSMGAARSSGQVNDSQGLCCGLWRRSLCAAPPRRAVRSPATRHYCRSGCRAYRGNAKEPSSSRSSGRTGQHVPHAASRAAPDGTRTFSNALAVGTAPLGDGIALTGRPRVHLNTCPSSDEADRTQLQELL